MAVSVEHLIQEIQGLDEKQLKDVANFIDLVKLRARYSGDLSVADESQLGALYGEFAREDRQLAEEGMAEYAALLEKEDRL